MTKRDITTKCSTPKFTDGMGPCASRRVWAGMVGFKGAVSSIPRVSIVVPFFGFPKSLFLDPNHKTGQPKKGTTMETLGRAEVC